MRLIGIVMALLVSLASLAVASGGVTATDMPGAIDGLKIEATEGSVLISGNVPDNYKSAGVKGVHIYRGTDPQSLSLHYTLKVYTDVATYFVYQDSSVSNGITYFYKAAAFNAMGDGEMSALLNVTSTGAPPAPRDLSAAVTCSHVYLTWSRPPSDGGAPITHYSVFRGLRGGDPTLIANTTSLSYDDWGVSLDDSFYNYVVCAVNENGPGKRSMTVFASLPLPVVSGRLTGTDGMPVSGATVIVDPNGTVAHTDSNGTFSIALPPGPHVLTVWVDGRAVHRMDLVTPAGPFDLGEIAVDDRVRAGLGLDTVAYMGIIAIVTAGMLVWAMGKAKIR